MTKVSLFLFGFLLIVAGCGIQFLDHDGRPVPQIGMGGNLDDAFEPPAVETPSGSGDTGGSTTGTPGGTPPVAAALPNMVVYEIPAGTANKAWASASNPIVGVVGQTLRIVNKDSVSHRIHTDGSPFNHTANIAAGATADFKLLSAITTSSAAPRTYEHNYGPSSPVFFNVTKAP